MKKKQDKMRNCMGCNYLSPGQVSRLLRISQSTLRHYEAEGLVLSNFNRGRQIYTSEQVNWVSCIRHMIQDVGISIPGLKRLLKLAPCWEIADCPMETRHSCNARHLTKRYLEREIIETPLFKEMKTEGTFCADMPANHPLH